MMGMQKVLIREGILIEKGDEVILAGSCCQKCGHMFFPPRSFCVDCFGSEMEVHEIGKRGVLYSFTTSYMPSAHFTPPYAAGWIEMGEQIRVFAPISIEEGQNLKIGMTMQLIADVLWEDGEKQIVGYIFKPALEGEV
ncbi:MAG: hypothetical protein C4554_11685 [Dethiobacter sp.]|jgi:uncharacterized OB-fold protein|nr:MAG: hypothetical protein C4554_11685 [Dethiobacter sp.]